MNSTPFLSPFRPSICATHTRFSGPRRCFLTTVVSFLYNSLHVLTNCCNYCNSFLYSHAIPSSLWNSFAGLQRTTTLGSKSTWLGDKQGDEGWLHFKAQVDRSGTTEQLMMNKIDDLDGIQGAKDVFHIHLTQNEGTSLLASLLWAPIRGAYKINQNIFKKTSLFWYSARLEVICFPFFSEAVKFS